MSTHPPGAALTPDEVRARMDGQIVPHPIETDRAEAFLPSPVVQNHAAFLHALPGGDLACVWFGGTLEGRGDISIYMSRLARGSEQWSPPCRLTDDPDRSEQNPVLFTAPDGTVWLQAGERNEGHCLNRSEAGREAYMRSELSRCRLRATIGSPFVAIWGRDVGAWMGLHTHVGIHWSWRHDPNRTDLIALLVRICGSPARPECEHSDKTVFAESICGGWQVKLIYGRSLLEGALEWTDYIVEQSEKHHLWPDIAGKAFGVSQAIGRAARSRHAHFPG